MGVSSRRGEGKSGLAPWAGLIASGTAWGLHHQLVTDTLHFDCKATADGTAVVLGLLALGLIVGGAFLSWRSLPAKTAPDASMRRFIAHMSVMAALLAALGLVFNVMASVILPGCQP